MKFKPVNLKVNYTKERYAISENQHPVFTWSAVTDYDGSYQSQYRIIVRFEDKILWDSGSVKTHKMKAVYCGSTLPSGAYINWEIELTDNMNRKSRKAYSYFKTALFDEWQGRWICAEKDEGNSVLYFTKHFRIKELPKRAVLYHCGLGLDKAYINGQETDPFRLEPVFTNYRKECQYITSVLNTNTLKIGENIIGIAVGSGWRKNYGRYLNNLSTDRKIEFMGDICLNAQLTMYFDDGTEICVPTDDSWSYDTGAAEYAHLFNGEVYNENREDSTWCTLGLKNGKGVRYSDFSAGRLVPQTVEPVCIKREIQPIRSYRLNGKIIYDFGENFAGTVRIRGIIKSPNGAHIVIRHAEETDESGELYTASLRSAEAKDTYISRSGERTIDYSPYFTYHGFRYASLEITGASACDIEVTALNFYTDIDNKAFFKCGNALVNEFYACAIRTERNNIHSIASDCPQRDERMGWLNDATVRFLAMPYEFDTERLFEKIIGDIVNEQDEEGRITCTAPFVYGERPADPVCSSFLIAAYEYYIKTGDIGIISKYYGNFIKWNDYLASRAQGGIVEYSYYGDWAGPEDCCRSVSVMAGSDKKKLEEYDTQAAESLFIPGIMVSTGCHYLNYKLLVKFAELLERTEDVERFELAAEHVKEAYIDKWFNKRTAAVYNGSQACQAFSLFIGIIPEKYTARAAELMNEAAVSAGYRIQTGNIITPMLLKMLSEYGYTNTAWRLMTRDGYPSWGYMIANGATTIWERFELKKHGGMNSHNHPMYAAARIWLYESLAGFKTIIPNEEYGADIRMPSELLYFEIEIPISNSSIYIKCEKKYGKLCTFTKVPFGVKLHLKCGEKMFIHTAGFHTENTKIDGD